MGKKIAQMPYKEAWEKLQKDYFLSIGFLYKHLKEKYKEEGLLKYLKDVEVERFRRYYQTFSTKLAGILEKIAPGEVFEKKITEIVNEFQFFLGVGNIEIVDLDSEKATVKIKQCPYAKANEDAPKDLKTPKELYCRFQCNGYIKDICNDVMGFDIGFEPKEIECIYKIRRIQGKNRV
ncbi:MAG: hypothetical protein V2A72_06910 [Candidatus Omnitrophota bacterium]